MAPIDWNDIYNKLASVDLQLSMLIMDFNQRGETDYASRVVEIRNTLNFFGFVKSETERYRSIFNKK